MDEITKFIIDKTVIDLETAWQYVENSLVYDAPVVQRRVDRAKKSISVLKRHLIGVENDRRSNCSVCGKELKLICKKCATPPVSTTAAV